MFIQGVKAVMQQDHKMSLQGHQKVGLISKEDPEGVPSWSKVFHEPFRFYTGAGVLHEKYSDKANTDCWTFWTSQSVFFFSSRVNFISKRLEIPVKVKSECR